MLQGVGTLFEFRGTQENNGSDRFAFLFVGRGLDEAKLKAEID